MASIRREAPEETNTLEPCQHLDCGFLAYRTVRKINLYCFCYPVYDTWLRQPEQTNTVRGWGPGHQGQPGMALWVILCEHKLPSGFSSLAPNPKMHNCLTTCPLPSFLVISESRSPFLYTSEIEKRKNANRGQY